MKVFALIPARLNSKRLPKKLMLDLGGMPIINRTYFNVLETKEKLLHLKRSQWEMRVT